MIAIISSLGKQLSCLSNMCETLSSLLTAPQQEGGGREPSSNE